MSCLSVSALFAQFVCQAVDRSVISQDWTDMLLKQCREPETHTVDLYKKERSKKWIYSAAMQESPRTFELTALELCVYVRLPHPRFFTGRVSFGITEYEADIFAELNGRLVLSIC